MDPFFSFTDLIKSESKLNVLSRICACSVHAQGVLSATPWTAAHQALLSVRFPRQEYRSGLLFPSAGDLHDPGNEPLSPASSVLVGRFFTTAPPRKPKS